MKALIKSKPVLTLFTMILLAGAITVPLSSSILHSHAAASTTNQTLGDLPFPSWWNGACDTNNYANSRDNLSHLPAYTLPKDAPVPASYRGVLACGPRPIGDNGPDVVVNFPQGRIGEFEWECVELSMRFMYLAYGIPSYDAPTGAVVVDNYKKYNTNPILVKVPNDGSSQTAPQPGDILSYSSSVSPNHTSVVKASNVDSSGNGTITVLEQNFSPTGIATLGVGKNANKPPWIVDEVKNWLHHTVDLFPQSGPPSQQVNIRGEGFKPNEPVTIYFDVTTLGTATTDSSGSLSTLITIPSGASVGRHSIQIVSPHSKFDPATVFYVNQTNWPMFGFEAQHTHYNPNETVLNPTNVSGLTLDWSYTTGSYIYTSSPTVVNGIVYFGSEDKNVYALDANTGALKWSYTTGNFIYSSPAVANGVVYIGSLDKKLYALDATTGAFKWSYTTGNFIESSPTVVNGVVYVGSDDNNLYALDATTGTLKWSYATAGIVNSSPAVADGIVYVGSGDNTLYALNATTGAFLWSYATGGSIYYSPTVVNGVVFISSQDGNLYALDATTGTLKWNYFNGYAFSSSPAVANGVIYIGSNDGRLYALDTITSTLKWTFFTGVIGSSSPAVANGVVYIGSDGSNSLFALDATTGAFLWSYATGGSILSSPAVVNGMVYVGSDDYKLYAFHLPGTT